MSKSLISFDCNHGTLYVIPMRFTKVQSVTQRGSMRLNEVHEGSASGSKRLNEVHEGSVSGSKRLNEAQCDAVWRSEVQLVSGQFRDAGSVRLCEAL